MINKIKIKHLIIIVLYSFTLAVQSQENIEIEYGVAFNKIAIDTATIENEEVKKHVLKSENESKRLLKDDRTLAILLFDVKKNTARFKRVEIMESDDQKSIYLAMSGVNNFHHDIKKNKIVLDNGEKEIDINKIDWHIEDEFKEILGYSCQKATTMLTLRNGTRKEIVAWFTIEIPIPTGPFMYAGLPGLILEVDNHLGRKIYARKIKYKKT